MDQQSPITIVKAGITDADAVRNISIRTFVETFSDSNPPENIDAYLRDSRSPELVLAELQVPESSSYLAKLSDGTVAGYLKINRGAAQVEAMPENFMEIERIYVLRDFQGMKIGLKLMEFALQQAAVHQLDTVWLGVWEHNQKAIRFYERLGFEPFSQHSFFVGDDEQTDILMKMILAQHAAAK